MTAINPEKLIKELKAAGIATCGCNADGTVWDMNNHEIQSRPEVIAVIAAHDPTPELLPLITAPTGTLANAAIILNKILDVLDTQHLIRKS